MQPPPYMPYFQFVERDLAPREQVLWRGVPRQGVVLQKSDWFTIPFSLFWCTFVTLWTLGAWTMGMPLFALFATPFALIGIYLLVGRFFWDARRRAFLQYAITNERVIIATGWRGGSLRSIRLSGLNDVSLDERPDGSGTIWLGPPTVMVSHRAGHRRTSSAVQSPTLEAIPRAREAYEILRRALASGADAPDAGPRAPAPYGLNAVNGDAGFGGIG